MSSSIDDRIVQLKFDNAAFQSAVSTTISTLDKLKQSLDFSTGKKALNELDQAGKGFTMGNIGTVVEGVSNKFLALATIGVTALSTITSKAISAGTQIAKSFTIDPVKEGFKDYNLKLTSVQTIMNATGKSITEVNKYFNELDTYADKTVFNLSDMTGAFAKFTNAGVDMKVSIPAIKGIANMVALAGQGAGEAQIAFYNLSQSIAGGFLTTTDYKSLNLANVATKEWKDQMVAGAVAAGTLKKVGADAYTIAGSKSKEASSTAQLFNEKLSDGWASAKVLTNVLGDFGDETTAIGKKALSAAQNVKSLPMMMDTLKASVGTGWTSSFEIILGNVTESTAMFTDFTTSIQGVLDTWANARNSLLKDWKELGGRAAGIEAIKNAFKAVISIIKPIKDAFREIFPAKTGQDLYNATVAVRDFFAGLKLGADTADKLKRTMAGVFAIFSIGKSILSGVIGVVVDLVKSFGGAGSGLLDATANIGDFLVRIDNAIKNGALIPFFRTLNTVMAPVNALIHAIGGAIQALFDGTATASINAAADGFGRVSDRLSPLKGLLDTLVAAGHRVVNFFASLSPVFAQVLEGISSLFGNIGPLIQNSIASGDYSAMLDTINTVIFGAIALLFKKFMKDGVKVDVGGGFLGKIGESFDALTGSLKAMEQQVKAKTLLMIAGAVALLTASVVALSLIDSKKLSVALAGMAAIFTELLASMAVLSKIAGSGGFIKIPLIAASMVLLAGAMLILSAAVKILSTISWGDMLKGLAGLAGMLTIIMVAMNAMPTASMLANAVALNGIAVAVNILAIAMKIFATMSWEEIGRGLAGVVGALTAVAAAMRLMPKNMVFQAAALILIGEALVILAGAISIFGTMEWGTIGKGLAGIGGALVVIAAAMHLMPGPMMVVTAAGLILVGIALNIIAGAMKIMATMSWEEMAKGLVGIAGALLILAGGLYLMSGALPGAAALVVAAGALAILAPVLKVLGSMSWDELLHGLVALAGALAVFGVAALVLSPIIPEILLLGAAVALLGLGLALAGAGVLAFATALTLLIAAGSLGIAALTAIMATVIGIIPTVMVALQVALVAFAGAIIAAAPALIEAIVVVVTGLLDAIIRLTPKIMQAVGVLLDSLIRLIVTYIPKLVVAGYQIITGILNGMAKQVPKIAKAGADLIIAFIKAIGEQGLRIIKAAGDTLIKFLEGLTLWINQNSGRLNQAGVDLVKAIIDGMINGIGSLGGMAIQKFKDLGGSIIDGVKGIFGIHSPSKVFHEIGKNVVQGLVNGVVTGKEQIKNALQVITDQIKKAKDDAAKHVKDLQDKLKEENKKPKTKANKAAIAKTKAELALALAEQKKLDAAYLTISKQRKAQEAQLIALGGQYEVTKQKLEDAQKAYVDAVKVRDDYAKSITDKYSVLPTLDATTSLDEYFDAIRKATEDNIKFKATLDQLRKLGLDDTSYKKFLEQGTAVQPFLDQLLASGGSTIAELNKIDSSLSDSATSLGKTASEELYQAGVNAAKGLVDGLEANLKTITDKMKSIGKAIADELKKELGIKSPSRVFMEIGKFTVLGLANGMEKNNNVIDLQARRLGKTAVDGLRDSMSGLGAVLSGDMELQPVIAPVLDLSSFRKDAAGINDILAPKDIAPTTSSQTAKSISAEQKIQQDMKAQQAADNAGTVIQLEQNNYSPKALSTADIYRQTKNQLSVVKEATA